MRVSIRVACDSGPGDARAPVRPTIASIQAATAEHYDVRLDHLLSKRRYRRLARPRQAAMYFCRELTLQPFSVIARHFGRDHSTVIHAMRQVEWLMGRDIEFALRLERLRELLDGRAGAAVTATMRRVG